ncbi:DUF4230 domain-containing protein [Marinoscillum sp.]|uniref:DUF4230 domain-containing protein n=1 Tax=Marinoscillum sp. TaxID=2024838 RepID=UPI003BAB010E
MIGLVKIILKILPWLLLVAILSWMLIAEKLDFGIVEGKKEIYQNTILTRMESMGRLELVQYNFQEVTEVKKEMAKIDLKLFKMSTAPFSPDSKAVLISQGSAAGCIDLGRVKPEDIREVKDTVYVKLPLPELCYFKLDLENSRLYDLEVSGLSREDRKSFMNELYKVAEQNIRESALKMGIIDQTRANANLILKPLLEEIAGKPVVLQFALAMDGERIK